MNVAYLDITGRETVRRNSLPWIIQILLMSILLIMWTGTSGYAAGADEEDCLICHKYPGLGRIDQKTGRLRIFYVAGSKFLNSVHSQVLCRNCHLNLDVIPHTDAKKVDCTTKCHIKEPSTGKEFSHGKINNKLSHSVHGRDTTGKPKKYPEDMPGCTDCHVNEIYQPVSDLTTLEAGISFNALRRCLGCHDDKQWTNRFYNHFSHRMHRSRTSLETVKLCLNCHQDGEMMARHGLMPTANYQDTYHWKAVLYGDPNAPDCLNCHAPIGYTVHSMVPADDPNSPVNKKNLRRTCAGGSGTQQCHPHATEKFVSGKIHRTGLGFEETVAAFVQGEKIAEDIKALKKERRFRTLISKKDTSKLSEQEIFQQKIYSLVKYVYTLLITVVIGGMLVHQILDFYRTVKSRKNHGE